ncbi:hypothetical protein BKA69DRAFT_1056621 [Paraphysoderma sedebokerense]|nr:hypothetical protein BKA69DRAFT_1056621 [Paraphysoderma sedebokerense]
MYDHRQRRITLDCFIKSLGCTIGLKLCWTTFPRDVLEYLFYFTFHLFCVCVCVCVNQRQF